MLQYNGKCVTSCPFGTVNVNGTCSACGAYYFRNQTCSDTCRYINVTTSINICEDQDDRYYCPFIDVGNVAGTFNCVTDCPGDLFGSQCLPTNYYVGSNAPARTANCTDNPTLTGPVVTLLR